MTHVDLAELKSLCDFDAQERLVQQTLRDRYNLDDPLLVQYGKYLLAVVQGDFGTTFQGRPVGDIIAQRFPVSLRLAAVAFLIQGLIGIVAGILAALRRKGFLDTLVQVSTVILVAIPTLVFAFLSQVVFGLYLGWFPVAGIGEGWYSYLYGDPSPANALIKQDNPDMTDEQLAYSLEKLKENGILVSGDALDKGIGCITEERYGDFFMKLASIGLYEENLDWQQAIDTSGVQDQARRAGARGLASEAFDALGVEGVLEATAQLAVHLGARLLGQIERLEPLAQLLDPLRVGVVAELLLDRLHLLPQKHFPLPLAELLLHLAADLRLRLEHADLPLQVQHELTEPVLDREGFEQLLIDGVDAAVLLHRPAHRRVDLLGRHGDRAAPALAGSGQVGADPVPPPRIGPRLRRGTARTPGGPSR